MDLLFFQVFPPKKNTVSPQEENGVQDWKNSEFDDADAVEKCQQH